MLYEVPLFDYHYAVYVKNDLVGIALGLDEPARMGGD